MGSKQSNKNAFTLIELLLVIGLVAFLFALSSKFFVRKKARVKNVFNEFIQLNNRLTRMSKLNKQTYRLVFKLSDKERDQYWVERKVFKKQNPQPESSQNEESQPLFEKDNRFYPQAQTLLPLLDIVKIEKKDLTKIQSYQTEDQKLETEDDPQSLLSNKDTKDETASLVSIYYYPSALAQETKIHFLRPDNKAQWILYLDPVSKELRLLK